MRLIRRMGKNRMAAQLHSEIWVLVLSLRSSKGRLGTRLALFTSKAVIKSFCEFSCKGASHTSSATVPSIAALTQHTHKEAAGRTELFRCQRASLHRLWIHSKQSPPGSSLCTSTGQAFMSATEVHHRMRETACYKIHSRGAGTKSLSPNSFNCQLF